MIKGNARVKPSKFNLESYKENNQWGIDIVSGILKSQGYSVEKSEENYGIDIKAEKSGDIEYFEVEVKSGYPFTGNNDYPFDTVSFLGRKEKWSKQGFTYVIVCKETGKFVSCHSNIIYNKEYKEILDISSRDRQGEDVFFRVPKNLCVWNKI